MFYFATQHFFVIFSTKRKTYLKSRNVTAVKRNLVHTSSIYLTGIFFFVVDDVTARFDRFPRFLDDTLQYFTYSTDELIHFNGKTIELKKEDC